MDKKGIFGGIIGEINARWLQALNGLLATVEDRGEVMDEKELIYDWNVIDYGVTRDPSNHPHELWFDDETLRDLSLIHI